MSLFLKITTACIAIFAFTYFIADSRTSDSDVLIEASIEGRVQIFDEFLILIKNRSNELILIEEVVPNCDCFKILDSTNIKIAPGSETKIVAFITAFRPSVNLALELENGEGIVVVPLAINFSDHSSATTTNVLTFSPTRIRMDEDVSTYELAPSEHDYRIGKVSTNSEIFSVQLKDERTITLTREFEFCGEFEDEVKIEFFNGSGNLSAELHKVTGVGSQTPLRIPYFAMSRKRSSLDFYVPQGLLVKSVRFGNHLLDGAYEIQVSGQFVSIVKKTAEKIGTARNTVCIFFENNDLPILIPFYVY